MTARIRPLVRKPSGALRPTIVPHMGLATPLDAIYAWLESEGYGSLVPPDVVAAAD